MKIAVNQPLFVRPPLRKSNPSQVDSSDCMPHVESAFVLYASGYMYGFSHHMADYQDAPRVTPENVPVKKSLNITSPTSSAKSVIRAVRSIQQ